MGAMELFLQIRRDKVTIFLDTKDSATGADVKKLLSNIIKRPPEDQRLFLRDKQLDDKEEIRHQLAGEGRAQCPATIGLALRDLETGEFEKLHITPYSEPPELPPSMEKDEGN